MGFNACELPPVKRQLLGQGFFMSETLGLKDVMAAFMTHLIYGRVFGAVAGNGAK